MFIDKLRLRIKIAQVTWKRKLAKKLINILTKLNYEELIKVEITDKVKIDTKRYIPQDGNWHHFAVTTDFWICNHEQKQSNKIYVDGERANRKKRTVSKRQEKLNKEK